jgi:amidase
MATPHDLAALDAIAQAELVRRKEVTAAKLVEAAIARIERVNPSINAVVIPMFEEARATARQPLPDGPLSGVPFLLKDLAAEYAGVPFSEASRFLQGYVPAEDQELVRRYKRAGLIVVGKTNTPELGLGPTTEPRLYGPTRNPWDITVWSCRKAVQIVGSSSAAFIESGKAGAGRPRGGTPLTPQNTSSRSPNSNWKATSSTCSGSTSPRPARTPSSAATQAS